MAYQPEVVSYDAGIYQLEVIDPVDGGVGAVSNSPLLSSRIVPLTCISMSPTWRMEQPFPRPCVLLTVRR